MNGGGTFWKKIEKAHQRQERYGPPAAALGPPGCPVPL